MIERCKVPFAIGKYFYEVMCDIVDINACQVLLDHLWQYVVDAIFMCMDNVYRFIKDRKRIILIPQNENPKSIDKPSSSTGIFTVTGSGLLANVKESSQAYVLVVKKFYVVESKSEISLTVRVVLDEFQDVIPEELPLGLPLIREI